MLLSLQLSHDLVYKHMFVMIRLAYKRYLITLSKASNQAL